MISSFRRYLDTWYVRGFFMLMVGSFVLWGVGDMLRVVGTSSWVAKVAGTTIEAQGFSTEYRRALAGAARNLPSGQEASPELRREVGDQTLQRMIAQAAFSQELADLRVVVPDATLADSARKMSAFRAADGSFDRARFEATLRNNGLTEQGFFQMAREDLARRQLIEAVTAGGQIPNLEAEPIYATQFEKRSADVAAFPYSAMPEVAAPDQDAAHRWYDNHPDLYATRERRRMKVVVLSPRTVSSEVTVAEQDVQTAYEQHLADYTTIARRSAQVISTGDEAGANALLAKWTAVTDWTAMEAAAKEAGASAIVQDNATQKEFPDPDLAQAVFSAPVNTPSGPIKGALGWFVVKVTSATEGGVTPFDQVKDKIRDRVLADKSLEIVYDRANKLDGLFANGGTLDTIPADLGVSVVTVDTDQKGFTAEDTLASLPGEEEIRSAILTAAFEAQKGDPPHLTEVQTPSTGGSGYFALVVEGIEPPGEKQFETVQDAVIADWKMDQRRHAMETAAAAMLKAVKDGKPFSDAARDAGVVPVLSAQVTRSQRDPGLAPEVHRVLFGLKKGEPTMVETAEGFLVAVPVEILSPDPKADPAGYGQLRAAVNRTIATDIGTVFTDALRLRANPRINQANVDQVVQP